MKIFAPALLVLTILLGLSVSARADVSRDEESLGSEVIMVTHHLFETTGALPALQAKFAETGKPLLAEVYTASNVEELGDGKTLEQYHHVLRFDQTFAFEIWRTYEYTRTASDTKSSLVRDEFRILTVDEGKIAKRWMQYLGYPSFEIIQVLLADPAPVAEYFSKFASGKPGRLSITQQYVEVGDDMNIVYRIEGVTSFSETEWGFIVLAITESGDWNRKKYTYEFSEKRLPRRGPVVDPKPIDPTPPTPPTDSIQILPVPLPTGN